ncbi:MAG TPA: Ku protein [Kofleriaceae bacterium]|nr:Ku protein [Kofleriaceae bacterium]
MPARSIGSGTISFGLVSIPVKLYTTNQTSAQVHFNMVHRQCGTKLKQQYICPRDEVVVDRADIAKGYEFSKGQYVLLSEEEIEALEAINDGAIQLTEFVPADKVDPVFFDRAYYLGPDKGGDRAYALIAEAMQKTGLVGLARYSARGKQYLVLLRPYQDKGLLMQQLRYADEVKSFDEVPIEDVPAVNASELKLATQIIEQIANDAFEPDKYRDEVKDRVLELIDKKVEGEEITAAPEAPQAQVIDLMEALKKSLGMSKPAATKESSAKRDKAEAKPKKKKKTA